MTTPLFYPSHQIYNTIREGFFSISSWATWKHKSEQKHNVPWWPLSYQGRHSNPPLAPRGQNIKSRQQLPKMTLTAVMKNVSGGRGGQ
jgi:hypothetical protein